MAIGDDAAAAGMDIVPGSTPANEIDTELNKTRDYIAQRTSAVTSIARGGTGATTAQQARTNLAAVGVSDIAAPNSAEANKIPCYNSSGQLTSFNPTLDAHVATQGSVAVYAPSRAQLQAVIDGYMSPVIYSRALGVRRSVYIDTGGVLGYDGSSERFKKNIRPEDITDEQVHALALASFQWKIAITRDDHREVGLIAERLDEAGLGWAVLYDDEGRPEGIHYERAWLALLPVVQRLMSDRDGILTRLEQLEARHA